MSTRYGDSKPLSQMAAYKLALPKVQQEFKQLRLGAVYWLAIEQSKQATQLAGQTLAGIGPAGKALLLAHSQSELDEVLAYLSKPDQGPANLHSYQLRTTSLQSLQQLPKQIDRALKPVKRLIVLLLSTHEFVFHQAKTSALLRAWRNWAEDNACTFLILSYGAKAKALAHDLYSENNSLSGLAILSAAPGKAENTFRYDIQHWRNNLAVAASVSLTLDATDHFFELVAVPKSQEQVELSAAVSSEAEVIFERPVLEDVPITIADNWQVVDSWIELIEKALSTVSPILVFALNSSADVEDLARVIYRLRQQRAAAIKIVVREMHHALRKQEVNLLTHCGASLVVPAGTQLAHFFNLLENIKRQPSVYQLTDDLEQALAVVKPQQVRGILAAAAFSDYVAQLLSRLPRDGFAGVLVALRPVPMLSAEIVLRQMTLTRMGDVACVANNVVYVFLFGCMPNFTMLALQRVFKLPVGELVIENQIYDEPANIEEQVLRIRRSSASKAQVISTNGVQTQEQTQEKKIQAKSAKLVFQPVLRPLG